MTISVADLAMLVASISITGAAIETGKAVMPHSKPIAAYSAPNISEVKK